MGRPNIILVMTDQHRADAVGFMANRIVQTPNLDSMAAAGVVFENAFVQCPLCMASRAAIHTGRYPSTMRVPSMGLLPPTEVTMAETLKRAGYITGLFGKLHFTPQEYGIHKLGTDRPIHDASVFLDEAGIDSAAMRAAAQDPYKREYGFTVASGVEDFQSGNYFEWLGDRAPELVPHAKGLNWGLPAERAVYDREPHATHLFAELGNDFYDSRLPAELHPSWYIVEKTVDFIRENRDGPFFAHCSFVDPHHPFNASPPYKSMYPPSEMPLPPKLDPRCYPDNLPPGVWSQIHEQNAFPDDFWQWVLSNYYGMISHIDYCLGRLFGELRALDLERDTIVVFISDHGEYVGDHRLLRKGSLLFESIVHVPLFISWPGHLRSGERIEAMVQEIDLYPTYYPMARTGMLYNLSDDPGETRSRYDDPECRSVRDELLMDLLDHHQEAKDPLPLRLSQA